MINTFNSLEELLLHYPKRSLGRAKDLTNQKFNRLTFICRIETKEKNQQAYWACKCECGKYIKVRATHVLQNKILSCGCYNDEKRKAGHNMYYSNYENLKNQKFNLLTVKDYAGKDKNNHAIWKCECECGNITFVTATHLKTGHTTSCGCTKESQYERCLLRLAAEGISLVG